MSDNDNNKKKITFIANIGCANDRQIIGQGVVVRRYVSGARR